MTGGKVSSDKENSAFASWVQLAKTDPDTADKVKRYEWRPSEELYALAKDPNEWHNLATNPEYETNKKALRPELDKWMKKVGDQGQQSEIDANKHQHKGKEK